MKRPLVFLLAGAALMVSDSVAQNLHGNAAAGQVLFKELKCSVCHSVNGIGGKSAPSLGGPGYTPNKMAGAMWSHVTAMWQAMDREGIRRPQLTEKQAADLYVFFAGGFNADIKGDSKRGQQIYEAKFCASCHDAVETGAPRLSGRARSRSSFSLVAALWRHGGGMLSRMVAKNLQWQQLSSGEVGDIIEYLNVKQ